MATVTRIEKRKRGIFGWVFLILFWAFNALMLAWFIGGMGATSETVAAAASDAERAGAAIGTMIGAGMILSIWVMGDIILGVLVLLTRGKKVIVETTNG